MSKGIYQTISFPQLLLFFSQLLVQRLDRSH